MTAQIHENLIFNGEHMSMAFCPPLPPHHARIRALTDEEIEAACEAERAKLKAAGRGNQVSSLDIITGSTGCWRRYQGTWQVKDGQFFLAGLEGRFELLGEEPLLADWFTGVLRVPRGKLLAYVHMGFGSVYEEELHIHVERGRVTGTRVHDNRGKQIDERRLGEENLPGWENRFSGDRDFN